MLFSPPVPVSTSVGTPPHSLTPFSEVDNGDVPRESLASALGLRRSPPTGDEADVPPELPPSRKRSPPSVPKGKAAAMIAKLERKQTEENEKSELPPPPRRRRERMRDDASVLSGSDSANVAQRQIKIAKLQRQFVS